MEARVTRVARRSAKGTGRASHEWNGRQGRGSESRQERRHNYRRSWNRPTCRWLNNIHCWCWDSGNAPIALEVTDVAGEDDVLVRSAASSFHRLRDQGHDLRGPGNARRRASQSRSGGFANISRLGHWSGHWEAVDSSDSDWELLLVEREVMIKGNVPVRGTATKPKEDPTRNKTTRATARKSNVSNMVDFCNNAVKRLRPC